MIEGLKPVKKLTTEYKDAKKKTTKSEAFSSKGVNHSASYISWVLFPIKILKHSIKEKAIRKVKRGTKRARKGERNPRSCTEVREEASN